MTENRTPRKTVPYSVADCILFRKPEDSFKFLVSYRNALLGAPLFVTSYLYSARVLVESLPERATASNDELVIPMLGLYVNALEFTLKFVIEKLVQHRAGRFCSVLSSPPNDFQRVLKTHEIPGLAKIVKEILPGPGALHHIEDMDDIERFVRELHSIGISSESTRYLRDTTGHHHRFFQKQHWICPEKLHHSVSNICGALMALPQGDDFLLCASREFSRRRLDELSRALEIMQRSRPLFLESVHAATGDEQKERLDVAFGEEAIRSIYEHEEIKERLKGSIDSMSNEELALLTMGLYFDRNPITIENQEFFEGWPRGKLIEKIVERGHLFEDALVRLRSHRERVAKLKAAKLGSVS